MQPTVEELQFKIQILKAEIDRSNRALHDKNMALDAMLWVWCNGGCTNGVQRYVPKSQLTEEIVATAERNTKRLRTWFRNNEFKKMINSMTEQERIDFFEKRRHEQLITDETTK